MIDMNGYTRESVSRPDKNRTTTEVKTYNSEDSLVVNHPTTNSPACGFSPSKGYKRELYTDETEHCSLFDLDHKTRVFLSRADVNSNIIVRHSKLRNNE
ncbi:hypothetical protein VN97_g10840 [Penicillium thymicola]|uniref:Uncharacterized protein n=1 Tax=Penicillium thymicola TaxID=293382 RepID=A0AAI9X3S0_PENTH|nr:hypothetical protein VN97_g10840 [Penicillium thymicola]